MKKRQCLRVVRDRFTPKRRREIAYHEAGHAAILWMFGLADTIVHVNMLGTIENNAVIRTRAFEMISLARSSPFQPPFHELLPRDQAYLRLQARQEMMFDLAGYATESKLNPTEYDGDWFDIKLARLIHQ